MYQYKDHLGNIRLSYTKNGATLQIVEENHYYPFGVKHKGYNNVVSSLGNSIAQKFKFNGKELDTSFDQNITEMDFRQYDAGLGRFYGLDLLAEATPWATPNHFALNNPIIGSDPTGLLVNFNSQSNSSEIYNPGVSGGFIDLFGNNKDSFLTNLKGFGNGSGMNGAGLGAGSGPGTGYSYINGGVGGINPGRTGNDRIDGRGGHYVRHSYSIVYHTDEETSLNKYDLTIENIQTKTWAPDSTSLDNLQTGLDVVGIADPTGIVDGVNALIYTGRGQWGNAGISAVAIIPYIGDVGKAGRLGSKALKFNENQQALIKLAKEADKMGGVTLKEAEILKGWDKEYNLRFRGPEIHPNRPFNIPHIHVRPVNHLPILP